MQKYSFENIFPLTRNCKKMIINVSFSYDVNDPVSPIKSPSNFVVRLQDVKICLTLTLTKFI